MGHCQCTEDPDNLYDICEGTQRQEHPDRAHLAAIEDNDLEVFSDEEGTRHPTQTLAAELQNRITELEWER